MKTVLYILAIVLMIGLLVLADKRDAKLMSLCANHDLQTLETCQ